LNIYIYIYIYIYTVACVIFSSQVTIIRPINNDKEMFLNIRKSKDGIFFFTMVCRDDYLHWSPRQKKVPGTFEHKESSLIYRATTNIHKRW